MESVGAAQSIVSMFGQVLVDELQEIRGVGDKVVHLTHELASMNAVLRMVSEADESTVDHLVREWVKQVRELANDAEDCTDMYSLPLRINCAPVPLLFCILKWPKYQLEKLMRRRTLAADIKALLARTTAVSERHARYGIDRAALPRSAALFLPVSSANALRRADDPDQFVGIKKQANNLAERVKARSVEGHLKLKVFSIVGFGGLGKTTLAMELFRLLVGDFHRHVLVSTGGKDIKGLLIRVLQQVLKEKPDDKQTNKELRIDQQMNEEDLASTLRDLLMDKRKTKKNRLPCNMVPGWWGQVVKTGVKLSE